MRAAARNNFEMPSWSSDLTASPRKIDQRWDLVAEAESRFSVLEAAASGSTEPHPSKETVDWARGIVLGGILPKHLLDGLSIDPFNGEIHAAWEGDTKSVIVFFLPTREAKIYYEKIGRGGEVIDKTLYPAGDNPASAIRDRLAWFFDPHQ
jgi:hypothetical protein